MHCSSILRFVQAFSSIIAWIIHIIYSWSVTKQSINNHCSTPQKPTLNLFGYPSASSRNLTPVSSPFPSSISTRYCDVEHPSNRPQISQVVDKLTKSFTNGFVHGKGYFEQRASSIKQLSIEVAELHVGDDNQLILTCMSTIPGYITVNDNYADMRKRSINSK